MIIGSADNEYNLLNSYDNGKTWEIIKESNGEGVQCYDRIIYGSTENKGLRYSDDGGVTLIESDHPTGNWNNITYVNEKVYASSMDGDGIYYSENTEANGIGEVWIKILDTTSKATITADENNEVIITTPEVITTVSEDNKVEDVSPNTQEAVEQAFSDGLLDEILVVVLNKWVLPKLVANLTGYSRLEEMSYFNEGYTYGNTSYNEIFSAKQLYQSDNSTEGDFTEEEYKNIAGMQPLELTISSVLESEDISDLPISESNLDMNDTLSSTLDTLDEVLNGLKQVATTKMGEAIADVPCSSENLLDLNLTDEELENALYNQKMFYEIQKASTISVVNTLLNAVYTFDVQRKIALLKAAIFKTVNSTAASINYQLKQMKKKHSEGLQIAPKDLTISYNFKAGLKTAINNYFSCVYSNLRAAMKNSTDLKARAAEWYKDDFREEVINSVANKVKGITVEIETSYFDDKTTYDKNTINGYLNLIYQSYLRKLDIILKNLEFDDYYTISDFDDLTGEEVKKVEYYCKDLFNKFKERCKSLSSLIYNNIINVKNEDGSINENYYPDWFNEKIAFYSLEKTIKLLSKLIISTLVKSFAGMKEMI